MSLLRFFQIIDNSFIGKFVDKKMKVLEETNPERIYVENIRRFYNMPFKAAKYFCEMAVHQHIFRKKYSAKCPNCEKVLISIDSENELPDLLTCDNCQLEEKEEYEFSSASCKTIEFYQLIKQNG